MRDSVTDLTSILNDPSLLQTRAYVAGEWVDADDGATFVVTNPARGDEIAQVADLSGARWRALSMRRSRHVTHGLRARPRIAPACCVAC